MSEQVAGRGSAWEGGGGGYRTADPEAGTGCRCRSRCEDGPAPGSRLQARPSVVIGRPGRTGKPSRRTRNSAEARTCRAMQRHSVVGRLRISFSMNIVLAAGLVISHYRLTCMLCVLNDRGAVGGMPVGYDVSIPHSVEWTRCVRRDESDVSDVSIPHLPRPSEQTQR